jgi:predicted nucleotidyltransferase
MHTLSQPVLEEIARKVAEASKAASVVLFGSRSRGMADEQSDVDLALIFEDPQAMAAGIRDAHRTLWPRVFPVDLVPITSGALRRGDTLLAREIARTGVVLYGRRPT